MLDDIIEDRKRKLEKITAAGINPYPPRIAPSVSITEIKSKFNALEKKAKPVSVRGRLLAMRDQGKVLFADLADEEGKIQVVLKEDSLSSFAFFKETLDRGDFVWVRGIPFRTKKGEKSIGAKKMIILAKSVRPFPTSYFGLKDTEAVLRRRYLDFILKTELKDIFRRKAVFWNSIRDFLRERGFLEVETPVLESIPGGAEAEPFVTHHNALDQDFYLRISPELNLKRLMIAGFEKIFEIGRIFRNEGMDAEHLQDYTQVEIYWAYKDYEEMMKLVEIMIKRTIRKTFGALSLDHGGRKINWGRKWPHLEYGELFRKATKLDMLSATKEELLGKAKSLQIETAIEEEKILGRGRLIDLIYKRAVRPNLIEPAFLLHPPADIEPLAKRVPGRQGIVERFQVVACGTELGKGFSELNDPIDQRRRFDDQMALRAKGDREAQMLDEDYLEAMEYGMPPTAGFGCSERLFSVLIDKSIRETSVFPLVKRKQGDG